MESYIDGKKNIYCTILDFLENINEEESNEVYFDRLISNIKNQQIEEDCKEMKEFLLIIKNISDHHHRDLEFNKRINQILLYYKKQIISTLSNIEIFNIFEDNKLIVLFLLKNGIITISESVYKKMINKVEPNNNSYWHFFYPEIENLIGEEKMKFVKDDLIKNNPNFFDNYEEKRQEGENDSYICSLIRQDSIEEFISYVNRMNYSLSSQITPSIFETNSFLINNEKTTLIEYSAFFGSIQIFQYLLLNKIDLKPSLWLYSIHSKNAELFHLLESNEVQPPEVEFDEDSDNYFTQCLIEAIKCHHNDFADYIENNLLIQNQKNKTKQKEQIISNCLKYLNYLHIRVNDIFDHGFFYLCQYNYNSLIDLLLRSKEDEIQSKLILKFKIF